MEESKTNNTTNTSDSNSSQSQNSDHASSITFVTVPTNERANIQKGKSSQPLTTKVKKK